MRLPTLTALALVAAGCATSGAMERPDPFSGSMAGRQEIQIKVLNLNFSDATIRAIVRGGRRLYLGAVTGKREAVFNVPWDFSEPLRLEIDMVAGPRCTTEELMVDPGDLLELQIAIEFYNTPGCR